MGDAQREREPQEIPRNRHDNSMEKTAKRVYPVETHPKGPWPLLVGLEGVPGSGKTFSALRLARGIQSVRPGPIRIIDTEAGRSGTYRAQIDFGMVRLDPPYRPSRFLACIKEVIALDNPCCVIVDSLSDEHEGAGGVLEYHEEEINRRLGKDKDNWARREAMSMAAWIIPKAERNQLINGILRFVTPIIVTFRAREKTRPVRDQQTGKTTPTKLGYQAIAPAEICHAMTAMCLLPPHAEGKPIWRSEEAGQDFLLKRPNFLADILTEAQLDETTGAKLATWSQGTQKSGVPLDTTTDPGPIEQPPAEIEPEAIEAIQTQAREAAKVGKAAFAKFCRSLTKKAFQAAVMPIVVELEKLVAQEKEPTP